MFRSSILAYEQIDCVSYVMRKVDLQLCVHLWHWLDVS